MDCILLCVCAMASLQELQTRLAEMKAEQGKIRAERGKEAQRQKRSGGETHMARILHNAGTANVAPTLPKQVASELILLLDLAGFYNVDLKSSAVDVVTSYALGQGRPDRFGSHGFTGTWDKGMRANICAGVELLYIHTDDSKLTPGEYIGYSDSQLSKLCKYAVECRLFSWLLDQNCRKGVNPGPSHLLTQAAELIPTTAPAHIRTGLRKYFLNTESTTARHWVESYKERWGVEAAINETGQDVDPENGDFQVPWLSCVGPFFWLPWARFFK